MQISDITFHVDNLKDVCLGARVTFPHCMKSNYRLVNVSGDNNLCLFQYSGVDRGGDRRWYECDAQKLLHNYCMYFDIVYNAFKDVELSKRGGQSASQELRRLVSRKRDKLFTSFVLGNSSKSGTLCPNLRDIYVADFTMHLDALTKIVPRFFALVQMHYAKWILVHLRDMTELSQQHPEIYMQFKTGHFAKQKSKGAFSAISLEQALQQNNARVKCNGVAVGLIDNPNALMCWKVVMNRHIKDLVGIVHA